MSPTLNGSSALQRFERGNTVKIHNRMFDFYPGLPHMWWSRVEIEHYSVTYLIALPCPKLRASIKGGAHTRCIDVSIYRMCTSPAFNGSSALQCFKCSEIHNRILDFYPGLPHITVCKCIVKHATMHIPTPCSEVGACSGQHPNAW